MAVDAGFRDHVLDLLSDLAPLEAKGMFGGVGIYQSGLMFALIFGDSLYLKADSETEARFEAAGSGPFSFQMKDGRTGHLRYWRLPEDAAEDRAAASDWARLALQSAIKARPKAKGAAKTRAKPRAEPELLIDGPWDDD
jgi:DNA transformation protein